MLEGQRAFLSQEGHNQAQIPKTDYPGALHLDIRHQRQGTTVTSVKVDVPRLLGKSAHSASCSRVWEKPHTRFSLEPPPPFYRGQCAHSQVHASVHSMSGHQRGHMGGGKDFQGASGQAPCVLMTVNSPVHSDSTQGPSQTKKLSN